MTRPLVLITVVLSTSLVLVQEVPSSSLLSISEHPFVDDAVFGEVVHRKAMVLAWTIHDLVELSQVALFLLVASASALALTILFLYSGWPGPIRDDLGGLIELLGMNCRCALEPV
jgi:hypothetical protein